MSEPIVLARAVHFAASALAVGTVSFLALVAEPAFGTGGGKVLGALRRRCDLMIWTALGIAVLSGAAWLALLAADIYGAPVIAVSLHGGLWQVLIGTRFGTMWLARLGLAAALAALLPWPGLRWLHLALAGSFMALLALVGHAGATPGPAGAFDIVFDAVHLLAAAAWLGGLPGLALLLASVRQPKALAARAAARFSALGIASVGALLLTGIINSWNLLSGPADLITTAYGRLLALKIGLFALMLAIAAVNRFHLTPLLAGLQARRALSRNSLAETGLGLGVLLLVGALGTMQPTAHKHLPPLDIPADAAFVHIHTEEAMADVTIDPGHTGPATASIRLMHEDLSDYPTAAVRLALEAPRRGPPPQNRLAVRQTDGTWRVDGLAFPEAGNWTVRVIVREPSGAPLVLDAPIVIAPAGTEK